MSKEEWVLIHCHQDDSHVLVPSSNVVMLDGSCSVEDDVRFSYPGEKEYLTGTVKGISENYDNLVKLQNKLNKSTKPRRTTSFHEGEPRKAKSACAAKGFRKTLGLPPLKGQEGSGLKVTRSQKRYSSEAQVGDKNACSSSSVDVCEEDGKSDDVEDSVSSNEELSKEELQVIKKLSKRKAAKNFKDLHTLFVKKLVKEQKVAKSAGKPSVARQSQPKRQRVIESSDSEEDNPSFSSKTHVTMNEEEVIGGSEEAPEEKQSSPGALNNRSSRASSTSDKESPEQNGKQLKKSLRKRRGDETPAKPVKYHKFNKFCSTLN